MFVEGDLALWNPPEKDFGVKLMLFIGTEGTEKSDAFDILLCTPRWFAQQPLPSPFTYGNHHLFVEKYDYTALKSHVAERCRACVGDTWAEIAMQIDEWAAWEFRYLHEQGQLKGIE